MGIKFVEQARSIPINEIRIVMPPGPFPREPNGRRISAPPAHSFDPGWVIGPIGVVVLPGAPEGVRSIIRADTGRFRSAPRWHFPAH